MHRHPLFKLTITALACAMLSACVTAPPAATKEEKQQAAQANFDQACKYAGGVASTAAQFLPLLKTKLGDTGVLAVQSALAAVKTACATPLDINDAAAIIQRVYDTGGNVVALVIQAQADN